MGFGSMPLVRIMPAATGKSEVRAAASVANTASERPPETMTSAPSLRTWRKLPPSMDTALTSDTSRSSCSEPATQSRLSALATSPTVGWPSSSSSGMMYNLRWYRTIQHERFQRKEESIPELEAQHQHKYA